MMPTAGAFCINFIELCSQTQLKLAEQDMKNGRLGCRAFGDVCAP